MKLLRQEKGSALVMVMFMMLILTILGVAILSAAVGGSRRTLTRENDIQSLQLTQKTLDESIAFISANLNGVTTIEPDNLESSIRSVVSRIPVLNSSDEGPSVSTDLQNASGKLLSYDISSDYVDDVLKKNTSFTVTLKARGNVNGVERILSQQVKITMFPDFLQYAFGSEQNLIINGAPYIDGNIYAGNELRISNTPEYVFGSPEFKKTTSVFPEMVSSGQVYIQSLDQFLISEGISGILRPINTGSSTETQENVRKALNVPLNQVHIRNQKKFVQIDVEDSFLDKLEEAFGANRQALKEAYDAGGAQQAVISLQNESNVLRMPIEPVLKVPAPLGDDPTDEEIETYNEEKIKLENEYEQEKLIYLQKLKELHTKLTQMNASYIYEGNLIVDGDFLSGLASLNKAGGESGAANWLIVNGDLTLDSKAGGSVGLQSNVLVTGNVRFADETIVDSTMFVMGQTDIEDATIRGADDVKELVLISKGKILLNRVDAFEDTVQLLRGFFYTDGEAELYGVGSKFNLEGGFFAKGDLTVNAVVGHSAAGTSDILFDAQSNGMREGASRFKVKYNDDVYAHQNIGLPKVQQISVSAGKLILDH